MRLLMQRDALDEIHDQGKCPAPVYSPLAWPDDRPVPEGFIAVFSTKSAAKDYVELLKRIEHLEAVQTEGVARSLHQPGPEIDRDLLDEVEAFERWKPTGGWNMKRYSDDDLAKHRGRLVNMMSAINDEQMLRRRSKERKVVLGIVDEHIGGTDGSSREVRE